MHESKRYRTVSVHGEGCSVFHVVDIVQPETEQPCIVQSWTTQTEPQARFLADDFCRRHNGSPA